jgi:hypothetical protein
MGILVSVVTQTDRYIDRQTDRHIDRQTDLHVFL